MEKQFETLCMLLWENPDEVIDLDLIHNMFLLDGKKGQALLDYFDENAGTWFLEQKMGNEDAKDPYGPSMKELI